MKGAINPSVDLINAWNVSQSTHQFLQRYYILYWDTKYFLSQAKLTLRGNGTITHQGVEYTVILHECSIPEIYKSHRVSLSFRKLKLEDSGFVLVKVAA